MGIFGELVDKGLYGCSTVVAAGGRDELGLKADKHLTWLAMPWDEAGKDTGQVRWIETTLHLNRDVCPVSKQSKDKESFTGISEG